MEHLLFHDNVLLIFHTFRPTVLCFHKKQYSRKEKKYDSGYPDVYTPKSLGSQSDHRRSHKGCSFSTDIHQTKILSGTLRRNNFCKIRPGQCLPPWNIPTKIASTQNCHCAFINTAKMVIPIYAAIQIKISFPVSYFSASLPNRMENGNATNCVTSNARSSPVESKPPHRNHGKCNHHSCFKRKSHFLIPKHKNKTYNERNTASCISPGISDLVDRIRS